MTVQERFDEKYFVTPDGCWLWTDHLGSHGYGMLWDKAINQKRLAHRVSYELYVGDIPAGLHLDHLCRQRSCVNPHHLEPVTNAENARRGAKTNKICEHGVGHSKCKLGCKNKYERERIAKLKEEK